MALTTETLAVRKRVLGAEHPQTVESMNNLAALYYEQGPLDEADALWSEVLAIRQRVRGPDHPLTIDSMGNLSLLRDRQGRADEAGELYRAVLQKRRVVLGPDHYRTYRSLTELAAFEARRGHFEVAEPLFAESVAMVKRLWPDDSARIAGRRHMHARCLMKLERWDEAEAELLEADRLLAAVPGDGHADVRQTVERLAQLRDDAERP